MLWSDDIATSDIFEDLNGKHLCILCVTNWLQFASMIMLTSSLVWIWNRNLMKITILVLKRNYINPTEMFAVLKNATGCDTDICVIIPRMGVWVTHTMCSSNCNISTIAFIYFKFLLSGGLFCWLNHAILKQIYNDEIAFIFVRIKSLVIWCAEQYQPFMRVLFSL